MVWALTLSPEPEGPTLISHAASTSVRSSTSLSRLRGAQPPLYYLRSRRVSLLLAGLRDRDEYFDYYRNYHAFWKLYAIDLPDAVLKKVYRDNALRVAKGLPK